MSKQIEGIHENGAVAPQGQCLVGQPAGAAAPTVLTGALRQGKAVYASGTTRNAGRKGWRRLGRVEVAGRYRCLSDFLSRPKRREECSLPLWRPFWRGP